MALQVRIGTPLLSAGRNRITSLLLPSHRTRKCSELPIIRLDMPCRNRFENYKYEPLTTDPTGQEQYTFEEEGSDEDSQFLLLIGNS